jgi:hypothetical protein
MEAKTRHDARVKEEGTAEPFVRGGKTAQAN